MKLTCKEASHLISADLDGRLGLGRRIALRLHLVACDACVRVKSQMAFLRRAMASYVEQDLPPVDRRGADDKSPS